MRRLSVWMMLLFCAAVSLPLPAAVDPAAAAAGKDPASVRYILLKNGSGVRGVIIHRDADKLRVRTAYAVMHVHLEHVARVTRLYRNRESSGQSLEF